jgi:succinate dehydrogenase / fumarate reductase iron-sulfur subunit/fumarate reductase iron-sulfur subunit
VKVKIRRYPQGAEEFEIDPSQDMTLLELLFTIKESEDPSLTFRSMCRAGICGTCAVKLNGKPALACSTWISGKEEELLIEPLDYFPVIRDLVVDHEGMHSKLRSFKTWLYPQQENMILQEGTNLKTSKSWECILCGICDSVCPVLTSTELFGGPSALTRVYKHLHDPRNVNRQATNIGIYNLRPDLCTHCMNCSYACPKRLMPEGLIREEENLLVELGLLQRQTGGFDFLSF